MNVSYYHVTYELQSESTLYSCLNVKELLARSRRHIWTLSESNGIWFHNHIVLKRRHNHLAKLAKLLVWLNGWVFVYEIGGSEFESRCSHIVWLVFAVDIELNTVDWIFIRDLIISFFWSSSFCKILIFSWKRSTFLFWTLILFTAFLRFSDCELIFWFNGKNSHIT